MNQRWLFAIWLMLSLSGAAVHVSGKDDGEKEEARALFDRARTLTNLHAEGSAPYRLEARLFVRAEDGVAEGHYVKTWQSKGRWRDEMTFPRFSQVRVSTEQSVWVLRNTNHQPLPVVLFLQRFGLDLPLDFAEGQKVRISDQKVGNETVKCVSLRFGSATLTFTHEYCFESSSGVLTRETWNDWETTWEYSEYAPWSGKQYPRAIRIFRNGNVAAQARITKLADAPDLDAAIFDPPSGAQERTRCEDPKPPTISPSQLSIIPRPSRGWSGVLTPLLIEVGADGRLEDVVFLRSLPNAEQEHGLFIALKQRLKFQPAKCGKLPIPFTLILAFPL